MVALVGRPNVGKSTLFNRIVGKRKSITSSIPGVTRDVIEHPVVIEGRDLILCDTGGVYEESTGIDALVAKKSKTVMDRADVVIFMVDGTEITLQDELIADHLRPHGDKVIILANKIDHPKREAAAYEAYSLGYDKVFFTSAVHGLGFDDVIENLFALLAQRGFSEFDLSAQTIEAGALEGEYVDEEEPQDWQDQDDDSDAPEAVEPRGSSRHDDPDWESKPLTLAILGQPNTGKSTLLNAFLGQERAIVSPVAGTTRDVLAGSLKYKERQFDLLDTAGIRRKSRVHESIEVFSVDRALGAIDDADVVALLIDVQEGIAEQDKKIAHHVVRKGKGLILVLNKSDLYRDEPEHIAKTEEFLRFWFPVVAFAPLVTISAMTRYNIDQILDTAAELQKSLHTRVPTRKLNDALERWVDENDPPSKGTFRWRVRYMTQTSVAPLEFVVFVNRSHDFPSSYVGYLTNRLRRDFDFDRVPIKLYTRS